jgi:hypothetical protein
MLATPVVMPAIASACCTFDYTGVTTRAKAPY